MPDFRDMKILFLIFVLFQHNLYLPGMENDVCFLFCKYIVYTDSDSVPWLLHSTLRFWSFHSTWSGFSVCWTQPWVASRIWCAFKTFKMTSSGMYSVASFLMVLQVKCRSTPEAGLQSKALTVSQKEVCVHCAVVFFSYSSALLFLPVMHKASLCLLKLIQLSFW